MGNNQISQIKPPEGFILDEEVDSEDLPEGFVLDEPQEVKSSFAPATGQFLGGLVGGIGAGLLTKNPVVLIS